MKKEEEEEEERRRRHIVSVLSYFIHAAGILNLFLIKTMSFALL